MSAYRVEYTDHALRQLERIPEPHRTRIGHKVRMLADNPRPPTSCKLKDAGALHRIRVGDYRVLYEIHDRIVTVLIAEIGTRGGSYRHLS
jgi:mRNA interferase RelE/StbE